MRPQGRRYSWRVLAEGRHASKPSGAKPALIIGIVVLVAAAAILAVLLTGKNGGSTGSSDTGPLPVPQFAFTLGKVTAAPTKAGETAAKLTGRAASSAKQAADVMSGFYTGAFLDPNLWGNSSANYFADFDPAAAKSAGTKVTVLTLGPNAAAQVKTVAPVKSPMTAKVLFDDNGAPYQVVAKVVFKADATLKDGSHALVLSQGQYFLQQIDGSWVIVSFEVKRADAVKAPATPSAIPTGAAS